MINDWNFYGGNGGETSSFPSSLTALTGSALAAHSSASSLSVRSLIAGDFAGGSQGTSEGYWNEHRQLLRTIRDLLQNRYGHDYAVYKDEDEVELYWSMLKHDVKEGFDELQVLARIYETMESRSVERHSADLRIYPSLDNHLFAYPEWKVALARVPVPRMFGQSAIPYLFAESDEALRRFLLHSRERSRSNATGQLLLFTDGEDGLIREMMPNDSTAFEQQLKDPLRVELEGSVSRFFSSARDFYEQFGIAYRRGVLLYGKPGNGKTSLARSLAAHAEVPAICWQMTEHTSSESIREVFRSAEELAPMLLIVEDLECLSSILRSVFLNELDGMHSREGIYLVATTNYPDQLDPALLGRPGRIDRAYEMTEPSTESRLAYLQKRGLGQLIRAAELELLAGQTSGFSYAQMGQLFTAAVFCWHETGTVNAFELVQSIRQEIDKSKTGAWLAASGSSKVGFYA
ncbi:ATPase family associated with various cellular activities (AAA) [Paenibacillaceae bacterium GAS479]|nr:ATPase family associated with various cellular activities (AAA) [Paenibacillaceae bacterium GAS479]